MIEIVFHGTGGQGVVVVAKILADAATRSGHWAQSFAAYGGERRGGKVESYLRVSETPVPVHCKIYEPDYVIFMNEDLAREPALVSGVKPEGMVLVNSSRPAERFAFPGDFKVRTIDASRIAAENGVVLPSGLPVINTTIAGAIAALVPQVRLDKLADAIREGGIPVPERNIKAARAGYDKLREDISGTVARVEAGEARGFVGERYPVARPKMPPCEADCPAGEPVQKTVSLVREGRFQDALENIMMENPFPGICGRVCFHPCETHCNRNEFDAGIRSNALERAAFDHADPIRATGAREKTGKEVAIVGSGPAGMACAYFLALLGHDVTVFEESAVAGGVPRTAIPQYRLPRDITGKEVGHIADLGVDVRTNVRVGKDISFQDLTQQYQATFVAVGAHRSLRLNIPGENATGVVTGLGFLKEVASGSSPDVGSRVVVVGGGNVAVDAARTAKRLGAPDVRIVCLESRDIMPAYPSEVDEADKEGIDIVYQSMPVRVRTTGGGVAGLECLKVTGGRRNEKGWLEWPGKLEGTGFVLPADSIIVAIGNAVDTGSLPAGIEMQGSLIRADHLGRTSMAGVFAGGDATLAPGSVVEAIASGKRAAIAIDMFLMGGDDGRILKGIRRGENGAVSFRKYLSGDYTPESAIPVKFSDLNTVYFSKSPRARLRHISPAKRVSNFGEVNRGLSRKSATAEAERCFQCGHCNLCENCYIFCPDVAIAFDESLAAVTVDRQLCKVCGLCVTECPRNAMSWETGND